MLSRLLLTLVAISWPGIALAAELDGRTLGLAWALPFAGMLLSIALFPLLGPPFWEHHYGKVARFWAIVNLAALALSAGPHAAGEAVVRPALVEYIPFILLPLALFTGAGVIVVLRNIH